MPAGHPPDRGHSLPSLAGLGLWALCLLLETAGIVARALTGPAELFGPLPGPLPGLAPSLAPGCLVIDTWMPAFSGLKLRERLAAKGVDGPTVVISGHGEIEACRTALRNNAIDVLSKPVANRI